MLDFEAALESLAWIPEEMAAGMAFFEGVVPRIGNPIDAETVGQVTPVSPEGFEFSVWHDDTPTETIERTHTVETLLEFFRSGTIVGLTLDYFRLVSDTRLDMRVMFQPRDGGVLLEMLCRRAPILDCPEPMRAIRLGIGEFARVCELFEGNALFVGPDCFDIPTSPDASLADWLRVL